MEFMLLVCFYSDMTSGGCSWHQKHKKFSDFREAVNFEAEIVFFCWRVYLSEAPEKDSEGTVCLEIVLAITPDGNLLKANFNEDGSMNSRFDSGCFQNASLIPHSNWWPGLGTKLKYTKHSLIPVKSGKNALK